MPSPNDDFVAGQILTSTECNQFPRGLMAYAESSTSYTLTTTETITTGMTVTFTAVSGRLYKVSYMEPIVNTPSVASGQTTLSIRLTDAAGTLYGTGRIRTPSATPVVGNINTFVLLNFGTSGSKTLVGTSVVTSTTGTPIIDRSAFNKGYLLVEDLGLA